MLSTIMIVLGGWLGLNAAFVAIRFFFSPARAAHAERDLVRYPRVVN